MVEVGTGRLLEVHDDDRELPPLHQDNDGKPIAEWVDLKAGQGRDEQWDAEKRVFVPIPEPVILRSQIQPELDAHDAECKVWQERLARAKADGASGEVLAALEEQAATCGAAYSDTLTRWAAAPVSIEAE